MRKKINELKLTQVLELLDKNIKAVIITVFYTLKKLIVDVKVFFFSKKLQLTGMKTTMSEMKNTLATLITDIAIGKKRDWRT